MYVEPEICELFTSLMLYAWVSAQNCANILNAAVKRARGITPSAEISISLSKSLVHLYLMACYVILWKLEKSWFYLIPENMMIG